MMVDALKEVGTLHWLREWWYISQKREERDTDTEDKDHCPREREGERERDN